MPARQQAVQQETLASEEEVWEDLSSLLVQLALACQRVQVVLGRVVFEGPFRFLLQDAEAWGRDLYFLVLVYLLRLMEQEHSILLMMMSIELVAQVLQVLRFLRTKLPL